MIEPLNHRLSQRVFYRLFPLLQWTTQRLVILCGTYSMVFAMFISHVPCRGRTRKKAARNLEVTCCLSILWTNGYVADTI